MVFVVLLAVNWLFVLLLQPAGEPRVKVPFSPYFLNQLQAGEVKSISSKGDTIQGTFATKLRYPPNDTKATPTTPWLIRRRIRLLQPLRWRRLLSYAVRKPP